MDDEEDVRVLKASLRQSVKASALAVVGDAVSAIEYLRSVPASGDGEPVLLITSVNMSPGDGFYLLEWVRASPRWHYLPVVVVSSDLEAERTRAEDLGANVCYQKGAADMITKLLGELHRWV